MERDHGSQISGSGEPHGTVDRLSAVRLSGWKRSAIGMMCTLDVAWKSAQVLGGARGYEAAGAPPYGGRPCGGLEKMILDRRVNICSYIISLSV